jgi:lysine/ornithine N-monooxygenase
MKKFKKALSLMLVPLTAMIFGAGFATPTSADGPGCSRASYVHRFYSPNYDSHFYTNNETEKDLLIDTNPNWDYEGRLGYSVNYEKCSDTTKDVDKPVYRFYSPERDTHFFTMSEFEKDNVIANDPSWNYEGIGFYAYSEGDNAILGASNFNEVYRFYFLDKESHFYTTSELERDKIIADYGDRVSYDGIAFYTLTLP